MRILLVSLLLLLIGCVATPIVVEDNYLYEARAFNWDKEKWIDIKVVFKENDATIFLPDETRTLFLVQPREPKNPNKIEAIDEERDVHWDIKVIKIIKPN